MFSPMCKTDTTEGLGHFMLECPLLSNNRRQMFNVFSDVYYDKHHVINFRPL